MSAGKFEAGKNGRPAAKSSAGGRSAGAYAVKKKPAQTGKSAASRRGNYAAPKKSASKLLPVLAAAIGVVVLVLGVLVAKKIVDSRKSNSKDPNEVVAQSTSEYVPEGISRAELEAQAREISAQLKSKDMVLQFQEEIALSEDILILEGRLVRCLQVISDDVPGDLAGQTGAGRDDPLVELPQQLLVHSGLIIVSFREGAAHYFHQVGVALVVLRQKDEVIVAVLAGPLLPVEPRARRNIDFAPDDGFDAGFSARFLKIDHAVHDAVIGYGSAVHAKFLDALYIFFDLIGAVQQRILGVDVQMCKSHTASLSAAQCFSFM